VKTVPPRNLWKTLSDFIFTTTPYAALEEMDVATTSALLHRDHSPLANLQRQGTLMSSGNSPEKRQVGFSQEAKPPVVPPQKLRDGAKLLYDVINAYKFERDSEAMMDFQFTTG